MPAALIFGLSPAFPFGAVRFEFSEPLKSKYFACVAGLAYIHPSAQR
jgi:hypothetical protein